MPTCTDIPAVRVGRVAGVPVLVDATFLFAVLTILLAALLRWFPSFWDFGAVCALVVGGVFLSILAHELGHALAARRFGLRATQIRIGGFFGLAILSGFPSRRIESILILLAGPLANAVILAVLWLLLGMPGLTDRLYFGTPRFQTAVTGTPALHASVQWLAYVNLGMLLFNLLPAFPLDGGRVARILLRSLLSNRQAVRLVASLGIFIGAWSCFGIVAYPTLLFVGPFLILTNYGVRKGMVAAPAD